MFCVELRYGIHYPADIHSKIKLRLQQMDKLPHKIITVCDNRAAPNRHVITTSQLVEFGISCDGPTSYVNFHAMELRKREMRYHKELSAMNNIYDAIIADGTVHPNELHCGWSAIICRRDCDCDERDCGCCNGPCVKGCKCECIADEITNKANENNENVKNNENIENKNSDKIAEAYFSDSDNSDDHTSYSNQSDETTSDSLSSRDTISR